MADFFGKLAAFGAIVGAQLRSLTQMAEPAPVDYPFVESDVAQLARMCPTPGARSIDQQTWDDLLVGRYLATLSDRTSIFGQQVLHQRLREGLDDAACAALSARLAAMKGEKTDELHLACRSLRAADTEIAQVVFGEAPPAAPWWLRWSWLLFVAMVAAIAVTAVTPLAWLAAFFAMFQMVALQFRWHREMEAFARSRNALQMLLRTCTLLDTHLPELADDRSRVAQINRSLESVSASPIPGLSLYANWFMVANVRFYFRCLATVDANRALLQRCFMAAANLEADVALARHQRARRTCVVERCPPGHIELDDVVHPLLEHAAPLDMHVDGGVFISGQNGAGKSTLLRTLGLNLIAARAFGFCYAQRAVLPALPVYASMQGEDSLLGGESLYIAELRRARELLAAAQAPAIFIIDEIFRGTNHLESVSAAAAVLDELAAKAMVVVSSHNLVLAALLARRLTPLCVSTVDADHSKVILRPGVLTSTNGVALLSQRGFGAPIEDKAARVYDWLSGYLAHPADCAGVLSGDASTAPSGRP